MNTDITFWSVTLSVLKYVGIYLAAVFVVYIIYGLYRFFKGDKAEDVINEIQTNK
jgi:uncharacterized membrane protein YqhA